MSVPRKRPFVMRKGNWNCKCGFHNFESQNVCKDCEDDKSNGEILDRSNMRCVRWRKKAKKKAPVTSSERGPLYKRIKEWSSENPYGRVLKVEMDKTILAQYLIQRGMKSSGVRIHSQSSKWTYLKLQLGTLASKGNEWLGISQDAKRMLNVIAQKCISTALSDVAQYKDCDRTVGLHGAVWSMPCGRAFELCSLIYQQPKVSLQQWVHKDGHQRYALPENESILYYSYFLNVIVPLKGDIPTLFRGSDRKLHASSCCAMDEIRVFNGGAWHAGVANDTSEGVWKLFIGLVPDKYRLLGNHPIFEDGFGKDAAKQKDRILLIADNE